MLVDRSDASPSSLTTTIRPSDGYCVPLHQLLPVVAALAVFDRSLALVCANRLQKGLKKMSQNALESPGAISMRSALTDQGALSPAPFD